MKINWTLSFSHRKKKTFIQIESAWKITWALEIFSNIYLNKLEIHANSKTKIMKNDNQTYLKTSKVSTIHNNTFYNRGLK